MKRYPSIVLLTLLAASIFPLYRFCHHKTDGFTPSKVRKAFENPSSDHLSSSISSAELPWIKEILNQPLHYIGRGGQCYAFATKDQKYVVKLLKYNNNYPKIWFRLFPFPLGFEEYRQQEISRKKRKLEGEYQSYKIALQELPLETGILYMHLDQGPLKGVKLRLFDKIKIYHELPADTLQFYIQKKGEPFYPYLEHLIKEKKIDEAKKVLDEMSLYLLKRSEKKIIDKDNGIWRNFAFQSGSPFQIDIGQFIYGPTLWSSEETKNYLLSFTSEFRSWLATLSPSLEEHFKQKLSITQEHQVAP